jgi:hypothetical protein
MIERTKQYRARGAEPKFSEPPTTVSVEVAGAPVAPSADAPASPSRREWFRSLVPSFGNGLVEILRASNNLKRDLHEASRKRE